MNTEVVVVIGAGGIGMAIARRQGFGRHILLADFNEALLAAAVKELEVASYKVSPLKVDASSRESVRALADMAVSLGSVINVVNTAGVSPNMAPPDRVLAVDKTEFDKTDFRNTVPRFTADARKANQTLVDTLGQIAEQKKATKAQIALVWLLAQKPWIVPIPGTTKLHRLEENLGGASVELTSENLASIHEAISAIEVQGDRYPAKLQALINR